MEKDAPEGGTVRAGCPLMPAVPAPSRSSIDGELRLDERPTVPPPPMLGARRPSGMRRKARPLEPLDALEEALLARPLWDSREPEPAIHEILYRLEMGDEVGAVASVGLLLDGRRVPAFTVSLDILDELSLDHRAVLFLGHVDGTTPLSRVMAQCGLEPVDALRTLCDLVERRIILLRAPR